jgi:hypothetical protein
MGVELSPPLGDLVGHSGHAVHDRHRFLQIRTGDKAAAAGRQ